MFATLYSDTIPPSDKCQKAKDLSDAFTTFEDEAGIDVSDSPLPQNTPITIVCADNYAQKFAQVVTQNCEAWNANATCKSK